ncbi:hypothetical protein GCM10007852_36880 [Agaribacter marinus]|uniref:Uncharacterized protein n=1 Tax=Agaribacter marinus TaxID=1431249 RepID=A0AA37T2I9_9ALTE|nr:hypothetical protein GCM10007852_36880 [Agaribacter marinus]
MIYYLIKDNQRVLVALYSKAEQSDIRPEDIKRIIDAYDE